MKKILRTTIITLLAFSLLLSFTACTEKRVHLSKNMLVANTADATVDSITLDVADGSLDSPIELLDSPLMPGETRAISIAVPEKQAKNSEWIIQCFMDFGVQSNPFEFGDFNPHGDGSEISCFGVYWNSDKERYMVKVYVNGSEADDGIYAPGEKPEDAVWFDSDDYNGDVEDLSIIKGAYYESADEDGGNIQFHDWEDGSDTLQFNHFEKYGGLGSIYGGLQYTISGNTITVTDDDEYFATLTIIDSHTIQDEAGNIYTADEAYGSSGEEADVAWEGIFISDEGIGLAIANYDGQSFQFAFASEDDEDEGVAEVNPNYPDSAESDGYTFWFVDEDTLMVSGSFGGMYVRE